MGNGPKSNKLLWMAAVFLVLAVSFLVDFWGEKRAVIEQPLTDPRHYSKEPIRDPLLFPMTEKEGYLYQCNDCHQHLEPSPVQKSYYFAHPDIVLDHGVNNYCATCHSPADKEKLLDINNDPVPFDRSHLSCLQCHGPIYRDWEKGLHGRMVKYWDDSKEGKKKLTCVACHDPHQPKFPPMTPAPAPTIKNYRDQLGKWTENVKDPHER